MKIKTCELKGAALDWAVAKCEGFTVFMREGRTACSKGGDEGFLSRFSTSWNEGGPIIEREDIMLDLGMDGRVAIIKRPVNDKDGDQVRDRYVEFVEVGGTYLEAAMRCYVASKLGDEVEVPAELI